MRPDGKNWSPKFALFPLNEPLFSTYAILGSMQSYYRALVTD